MSVCKEPNLPWRLLDKIGEYEGEECGLRSHAAWIQVIVPPLAEPITQNIDDCFLSYKVGVCNL